MQLLFPLFLFLFHLSALKIDVVDFPFLESILLQERKEESIFCVFKTGQELAGLAEKKPPVRLDDEGATTMFMVGISLFYLNRKRKILASAVVLILAWLLIPTLTPDDFLILGIVKSFGFGIYIAALATVAVLAWIYRHEARQAIIAVRKDFITYLLIASLLFMGLASAAPVISVFCPGNFTVGEDGVKCAECPTGSTFNGSACKVNAAPEFKDRVSEFIDRAGGKFLPENPQLGTLLFILSSVFGAFIVLKIVAGWMKSA